jgi:predicted DnaQ family exonuclease/DinG family helicase
MNRFDTYIAFDLETSGLNETDKIIEFGGILVENKKIKDTYQTLINPGIEIPLEVYILTGIDKSEIIGAPSLQKVKDSIIDFIGERTLIAHNAPFDVSFLHREGIGIDNTILDTLEISQILLPFLSDHRLETIYHFFETGTPTFHRALADAQATSQVFLQLLEIIETLPHSLLENILRILETVENNSHSIFQHSFLTSLSTQRKKETSKLRNLFTVPENVHEEYPDGETAPRNPTEKTVEEILSSEKILSRSIPHYEKRKEQIDLSKVIMKSLKDNEILISEAGAGVGKTFAYLVPTILWSNYHDERILISTYTKTLEDQLFYKDIQNLSKMLKVRIKSTLMKGRNNYLCVKNYHSMFKEDFQFLNENERKELLKIIVWKELTHTGDISENNSFRRYWNQSLWSRLSCDTRDCEMNKCRFSAECYLLRIRKESLTANIVTLNHSLLFSDLVAEQRILGDYERLIIDEAHNIEKAATDFLGSHVSSFQIQFFLDRLHRKGKGILITVQNLLSFFEDKEERLSFETVSRTIGEVDESRKILTELIEMVQEELENSEYRGKLRLQKDDDFVENIISMNEELHTKLRNIIQICHTIVNLFSQDTSRSSQKETIEDLKDILLYAQENVEVFYTILSCRGENFCFWVEPSTSGNHFILVAAPIVVSGILQDKLFKNLTSGILLSATLCVENSFTYFKERFGLSSLPQVHEFRTGTPFDFKKQTLVLLPTFISSPQYNEFFIDIVDILRKTILSTRKGTLVLFTSYKLLNDTYYNLVETLHQNKIHLLAQGHSGSKSTLLREFKKEKESVLFGTYSFWEGVDIPGDSLENLIITKLPFPSPKEPIIEARSEFSEERGLNGFHSIFIPETIIKLRQGFGRLIRSKKDRGIIILLDTRLVKKRYGMKFLNSLPAEVKTIHYEEDFVERIKKFFDR